MKKYISLSFFYISLFFTIFSFTVDAATIDYQSASTEEFIVEDNWLNREVARQVFGDENRFSELTESDYLSITKIKLQGTKFNADIPKDIGRLENLGYLDLRFCGLTGELPEEIGNLKKVSSFLLSSNNLTGSLPKEICDMTSLSTLLLHNNNFYGELPENFASLRNLYDVDLSNNNFSGKIPKFGNYNLRYVELYGNNFSDISEMNFTGCTRFVELNLGKNNISASLDEILAKINSSLSQLYLNDNLIYGEIPESIKSFSFSQLNLSNNNLTGDILSYLNLSRLFNLNLSNNEFYGQIPDTFTNPNNKFKTIILSNNNFTGEIPGAIFELPKLESLCLNGNNFTGSIGSEIGNSTNLYILNLSYNNLSGKIPTEIENLRSLNTLNLSNNLLSGDIPKEIFEKLINITYLDLSNNKLTGELPATSGFLFTRLKKLKLNNNLLSGAALSCVSKYINLEILDLSNNKFTGDITYKMNNLTELQELNLSNNNFTGTISWLDRMSKLNPDAFKINNNLLYGNVSTNSLKKYDSKCFESNFFDNVEKQNSLTIINDKSISISLKEFVPTKNILTSIVGKDYDGNVIDISPLKLEVRSNNYNYIGKDLQDIYPGETTVSVYIVNTNFKSLNSVKVHISYPLPQKPNEPIIVQPLQNQFFRKDSQVLIKWTYESNDIYQGYMPQQKAEITLINTDTGKTFSYVVYGEKFYILLSGLESGLYNVKVRVFNSLNPEVYADSKYVTFRYNRYNDSGIVLTKQIKVGSKIKYVSVFTDCELPKGTSIEGKIYYKIDSDGSIDKSQYIKFNMTQSNIEKEVLQLPEATDIIVVEYTLKNNNILKDITPILNHIIVYGK